MEPADTLLMRDEDSSTNPARETNKFIKSSVDDLVSIPRESGDIDTLSTKDKEIDFNPSDLETIDSVPDLRIFNVPLVYFASHTTPASKQFSLRVVEKFDHFFSLTQSGGKTRVMETSSFGFHHMPSLRPAAYSPKEVMYRYYHPHLTSSDGFNPEIKKIPSDESKVQRIENKAKNDNFRLPRGMARPVDQPRQLIRQGEVHLADTNFRTNQRVTRGTAVAAVRGSRSEEGIYGQSLQSLAHNRLALDPSKNMWL
ncbi:hypothetical protein Tco_0374784 [Tanacetum coccineum]